MPQLSTQFLASVWEQYHWQATLYALAAIVVITAAGKLVLYRIPTIKAAMQLNQESFQKKLERPSYAAIMQRNGKAGKYLQLALVAVIFPFSITLDPQPWWKILLDIFIILMVYDFFYYLTHRFLFHDNGFLGGPLLHVHAVHHRQHVPCRFDGGYLNVWEQVIGVGLFAGSIFFLALAMGDFHVATIVICYLAFMQINLHNHDLWTEDRFPFGYVNHVAKMHHNHHISFTSGNYATITLFYDWLFGTLDYGSGYKKSGR